MKRILPKLSVVALATLLIAPVAIHAQDEKDKDKDKSDKKDGEQIIITRKNADQGKVTVVIDGDKVTVNGKPIEVPVGTFSVVSDLLLSLEARPGRRSPVSFRLSAGAGVPWLAQRAARTTGSDMAPVTAASGLVFESQAGIGLHF